MGLKFSCGVGFLLLAALWQQQVMFPMAAVVVVVMVAVGDDAVLPCNLAPPFSMGRMLTVEWKRVDVLPTVTLLVNREGRTLDRERGQAYAGRTSLGGDGRSLRLANAGRHDQGTYSCSLRFEGLQEERVVKLVHPVGGDHSAPQVCSLTTRPQSPISLTGARLVKIVNHLTIVKSSLCDPVVVSRPLITLTRVQGRELLLGCEARDWFPEPEVSWQDGEGGVLPSDPPVIQRNHSHNLYNVWTNLKITAVKRMSSVLSCRATVQNTSLIQLIQLSGNWENAASDWTDSQPIYIHILIYCLCVVIGCMLEYFWRSRVTVTKWVTNKLNKEDPDDDKYSKYGNILEVDTTGASDAHSLEGRAEEDGVAVRGVTASQVFARRDLEEMKKYRKIILNVADRLSIHPCLIAAIISRQSRAGLDLRPNGYGKYDSTCHGLMQVNEAYHPLQPDPYGEEHILLGTIVLIQAIKSIKQAMENSWNKNQILKGGIAAYIGDANLVGDHYEELDARTPYGDFSNDVVARAQFYADNGFA
ncbi:Lysozyme g [Merluccius polli]|uniref:Lysozyme g n=1 Tax=Merluccius polli TaxID=89951 RepID=A0AA47PDK6_MERPO|nr:Lysozyme g [Merluccius polli]